MLNTTELIRPILWDIYGQSSMTEALVDYLGEKIDNDDLDLRRGREHAIMLACWNFFNGGGTAAIAARNIEETLVANGI